MIVENFKLDEDVSQKDVKKNVNPIIYLVYILILGTIIMISYFLAKKYKYI